jgi:hypothetical protein
VSRVGRLNGLTGRPRCFIASREAGVKSYPRQVARLGRCFCSRGLFKKLDYPPSGDERRLLSLRRVGLFKCLNLCSFQNIFPGRSGPALGLPRSCLQSLEPSISAELPIHRALHLAISAIATNAEALAGGGPISHADSVWESISLFRETYAV